MTTSYPPGLYNMIRITDQTGVSGTGRVAQVAVFEDGSAVTRWMTGKDSFAVWASIEDLLDIHIRSHPDTTKLLPAGVDLCEHGVDNHAEYCDPCAEAAVAADRAAHRRAPTQMFKRGDGGPATITDGPANIGVLCLTCTLPFTTSNDSYQTSEAKCPACGGGRLSKKPEQIG
jgi:hypothetical protein